MADRTILDEIRNNIGYSMGGLFGFITSIVKNPPFDMFATPGIKMSEFLVPHLSGVDLGTMPIGQILVFIINPIFYGFVFGFAYINIFKEKREVSKSKR